MLTGARPAFVAATQRLASYAAGADAAAISTTANEVLSVATVLQREPRLRRALTDSSRGEQDRVALLRTVFGSRIGGPATDLLADLVAGRWSRPSELLDAVEQLGARALLASSEALDELVQVEDELFRFGQIVAGSPQLAALLSDGSGPVERRADLVAQLLRGKATETTVRLVRLALAGFGGRGFAASIARLVELAAQTREHTIAYVTTAIPLTDAEEQRLATALANQYGRQMSLQVDVDDAVLGGVRVKVGSDLFDGTLLRRLTVARQALTR